MSESRPTTYQARSIDGSSVDGSSSGTTSSSSWGTRWVEKFDTNGNSQWREVPLTWNDLLDPQEGDVMVHGTLHGQIIRTTAVMLQTFFESQGRDDVLIADDVKMFWGIPDLANIGPDIAVIPGVNDPSKRRDSFRVEEEGTRPGLVIEVISKSTKIFDLETKPGIYEKAGVAELFVLDPLQEPCTLSGFRRSESGDRYQTIEPDSDGWLASEATGLRFRISDSSTSLLIEDSSTGEPLRNPSEEAVARRTAELDAAREREAREEAERRAQELEARLAHLEREIEARRGRHQES